MCNKNNFILLLLLVFINTGCDDNIDDANPLIGKWRSEQYMAAVETTDSTATHIIFKDIESINKQKHPIYQYEFMKDKLFVLYNIDNNDKIVGNYDRYNDTLAVYYPHFTEQRAIVSGNSYFNLYIKDMSHYYTPDSLLKLGIESPENITVKNAWLIQRYKRI